MSNLGMLLTGLKVLALRAWSDRTLVFGTLLLSRNGSWRRFVLKGPSGGSLDRRILLTCAEKRATANSHGCAV